ncbi:MAG: NUDIX domain-containing protein [Nanoarchaeota archaeon]
MPHIHEKIDFTAEVFIVFSNKVLLRKHDKYKKWLSVGGHIELDEDPNNAAIREAKEEVGLEIELSGGIFNPPKEGYKELIPPKFMNIHDINENHKHITLVYFAKSQTNKLNLSQEELSEECKWFSWEELMQNSHGIDEHIRKYAMTALYELKEN